MQYRVDAELLFPRRSLTQADGAASQSTSGVARVQTGVGLATTQVIL